MRWREWRLDCGSFVCAVVDETPGEERYIVKCVLSPDLANVEGAPEEIAAKVRWAMKKKVKLETNGESELEFYDLP